jgi:hypothetical protein
LPKNEIREVALRVSVKKRGMSLRVTDESGFGLVRKAAAKHLPPPVES